VPRHSKASLTLAHFNPGKRLEPPPQLGGLEAAIFRQTVASVPPTHFQAEDVVLLAAYARAAALERRASDELQACAVVGDRASPWRDVYATAVHALATLTVRLRLGPKSRSPNKARSAKSALPPSYYDTMKLEG
jgi:hypothetical protein